jgi:NAD(P)H-flavin reductase
MRAPAPPRAYSISNAPRPDGELVLQVARADGGVTSAWIHDRLAVGEGVKINGPTAPSSATRPWTRPCCAWPPAPAWRPSWR